ncbi:hypothetical protein [Sinomonas halotolerans]|uniref:Uncharacterized protein n=1 Tax=Sinomonas halotolerans TaxID=1644133 RepID=A0ABU9WZ32_9MICC
MAIRSSAATTLVCDGRGHGCPASRELSLPLPAHAACRRAVGLGWRVSEEVQCPDCRAPRGRIGLGSPALGQTAAGPAIIL